MCSVAGGMAGLLVDREIPSRLIPFRGEFPLLDMIEAIRFREAIRSTMWIEDLPVCRRRREPDSEIGARISTLSVEKRIKERRF